MSSQEKDLEVCQASLAVAQAAAELAGSDPSDISKGPTSVTSQQLEELEQLRRTVTSLHGELEVLRSMNTELQNEVEAVVSVITTAAAQIFFCRMRLSYLLIIFLN